MPRLNRELANLAAGSGDVRLKEIWESTGQSWTASRDVVPATPQTRSSIFSDPPTTSGNTAPTPVSPTKVTPTPTRKPRPRKGGGKRGSIGEEVPSFLDLAGEQTPEAKDNTAIHPSPPKKQKRAHPKPAASLPIAVASPAAVPEPDISQLSLLEEDTIVVEVVPLAEVQPSALNRSPQGSQVQVVKEEHILPSIEDTNTYLIGVMASGGRNRPRNGPRGSGLNGNIHQELWDEVREVLPDIAKTANRSNQLSKETIEMNHTLGNKVAANIQISDQEMTAMDALCRENLKHIDKLGASVNQEIINKLKLLRDYKYQEEQAQKAARIEAAQVARVAASRGPGLEYDGPSDSPGPSAAENKLSRKGGSSRTSSQPPISGGRSDGAPSEASMNLSKTKIVYAEGDAVAFKRKAPPLPEDWIQGTVCEVIGEGKSRRYKVKDDDPDPENPIHYRSSASQMVPIPAVGTPLGDYEPGKQVLALYPDTTTFYRAEVKAMLDGGKTVQLLFEDEDQQKLRTVPRRFVLDHKG